MLCSNCGQELSGQETLCPGCGQPVVQPEAEDTVLEAAVEVPADVSAPDTEPAPDMEPAPDTEAAEAVAPTSDTGAAGESVPATIEEAQETTVLDAPESDAPKSSKRLLTVILSAIIGLLLILVVCLTVIVTTLSSTGSMPSFITAISEKLNEVKVDGDAVVLQVQDQDGNVASEITYEQLSYYYWGEYYYYVQSYGFYFDAAEPLEDQAYSDDMSWQDYFLENAKTSIQQIEALKAAANAEGFVLTEEYQTEYDATIESMATYAAQAGFTDSDGNGDVLAYIQDSYGSVATEEGFAQYLYDSYYVTAYSDTLYDISFTEEEIEQYYDDNADMFTAYGIEKSDLPNVNVRHILIQPEETEDSGEESSALEDSTAEEESEEAAWAEAEAQRILEEWQSGDATEESFAELAVTYSADTATAANGGLLEDVYPGEMVTNFNDWCFDESRQPGDTGIVESTYGYHIMYYVSATEDYYWKQVAESELRYETYDAKLTELVDGYTVELTGELVILTPDAVEAIAGSV